MEGRSVVVAAVEREWWRCCRVLTDDADGADRGERIEKSVTGRREIAAWEAAGDPVASFIADERERRAEKSQEEETDPFHSDSGIHP